MFNFLYFIMAIPLIIIIIFFIFKFKNLKNKEKLSPFECGFDPFSFSRASFSLKFFFIGIIFLIFDVEIVLILPYPILLSNKNLSIFVSFILVNLIIMLGLLYEWKMGMIDWLK
uniref:NADH-ubiquinone oxidoreductase chain 3 n=1 Tax=Archaeocroton sphenodonti TaxID=2599316 RepID=H9M779_9ACAR|nr:NADH dehydrogenase subunit 3 [Archaeocroton sphenodonti]AET63096.1 NADH dehydrogenase subunit 3 [Archaeocroton sphenodonti]